MDTTYKDIEKIKKLAGTFWSDVYTGPLTDVIEARAHAEQQTLEDLDTLRACTNRIDVPAYEIRLFVPVTVAKSDDKVAYVQENIVHVPFITNNVQKPTTVLFDQIDYVLKDNVITFKESPIASDVTLDKVLDHEGTVVDEFCTLWLHNCKADTNLLQDCLGKLIGIELKTSERYKALLNIVYEMLLTGTTQTNLRKLLSVVFDSPISESDAVVEYVSTGIVVTDKVYKSTSKPIVTEGETVYTGQSLFDGVDIFIGNLPEEVSYVTIPKHILDHRIDADLILLNKECKVTKDDSSFSFDIIGPEEAIEAFWLYFNTNLTDAELVKTIPDIINPAKFFVEQILGPTSLTIVMRREIAEELEGLDIGKLLADFIPPETAVLSVNAKDSKY